ncbi:MAG: protein-export membrane protein SecD [Dasania sp.]|jgi:protein-export membrane protein SecD
MLHFSRWQIIIISILCILAPLFILPNFKTLQPYIPTENKINLGLDLQGGIHLGYQADTKSYFKTRMRTLKNDVRQILRPSRQSNKTLIGYRNFVIRDSALSFTIAKPEQIQEAEQRLQSLIAPIENSLDYNYAVTINNNQATISLTDAYKKFLSNSILNQTIEVMRRRIDSFGTREPNIIRQGTDRIILQVPGASNIEQLKSEVGKTAQMTFHMVLNDAAPSVQPLIYPDEENPDRTYKLHPDPLITGDNLINASASRDDSGQPAVSFKFDRKGSQTFARVTSENIGQLFAIVLDGKVISAPRIQSAILGGSGIITGNFTRQEASNLSLLLRSGSLPVNLEIVEERTIGPELGAESIVAGTKSLLYGFCAVALFMVAFYGIPGSFSVFALTMNTIMIFAVLSLLSATLTLPGIAGIVLGVGVAVDANVLINERIREELRQGQSLIKAVSLGYEKAWLTILDSHITGILSAVVMFFLGSGPIRGFAVTLGVGILLSLFTSVWISRLLFSLYISHKKPSQLKFGLSGA